MKNERMNDIFEKEGKNEKGCGGAYTSFATLAETSDEKVDC